MLATEAIKSWISLLDLQKSPKDSLSPIECALFKVSSSLPSPSTFFPSIHFINVFIMLLFLLHLMSDPSVWPESNHHWSLALLLQLCPNYQHLSPELLDTLLTGSQRELLKREDRSCPSTAQNPLRTSLLVQSKSLLSVPIAFSQRWWTFLKPARLSARSVASNPTKWHSTRKAKILFTLRESGVMTGSRVAMVGRLSRSSGKRLKLQRRLCWGLNVLSPTADRRECWLLRDASILNWEEIRRERAKWSSSKLHILLWRQ